MKIGRVLYIPYLSSEDFLPAVRDAIEMGFEHIEIPDVWTSWKQSEIDVVRNELLSFLETSNISVNLHTNPFYEAYYCALYRKVFRAMVSVVEEAIVFANIIGADVVTLHPLIYTARFKVSNPVRALSCAKRMFSKAVGDLIRQAEDYGIKLGLESFCWKSPKTFSSIFDSPEDFIDFVSGFEPEYFGVTLDTGHAFQHGVDINYFINRCKGLMINVHIHDSDGKVAHLPIGEGKVDFETIIETMKRIGYSGPLSLELFPASTDKILLSKNRLEKMLERTKNAS